MPHPKKRTSSTKKNMRRSHHALKVTQTVVCPKCKADILPHRVCPKCGYYKTKEVVNKKKKSASARQS